MCHLMARLCITHSEVLTVVMQPFPHRYAVSAALSTANEVDLSAEGVAPLPTAAPAEFDGPGDLWSPETLLVGAVADCFAITFRGVARTSKLAWTGFACEAVGTLDRVAGVTRFTHVDIHVRLTVAEATDREAAHRVLERVERNCLITSSLTAAVRLHATIDARTIDAHVCGS